LSQKLAPLRSWFGSRDGTGEVRAVGQGLVLIEQKLKLEPLTFKL
jgi:hypothetical protein